MAKVLSYYNKNGKMEIKKINTEKIVDLNDNGHRPDSFDWVIGQEHIKWVLKTAIDSAKKRKWNVWHILLSWPSGFGKTTIAYVIAKQSAVNIKVVTWYAITKPAEIISILNNLQNWDILFIDEIHRLRPNLEEVLYIAMEDFVIDMVMPDWWNVRIPISPFTLIWATTKPESLSQPIKNRFIYSFHFMDYSHEEKKKIVEKYLKHYEINFDNSILTEISNKIDSVPREIHNFCVKIRDYIVSTTNEKKLILTFDLRNKFISHSQISDWWLAPIHNKYLEILQKSDRPMWLKSIAIQLGINEQSVEEDIEPLLLKLGKIEKTNKGRVII